MINEENTVPNIVIPHSKLKYIVLGIMTPRHIYNCEYSCMAESTFNMSLVEYTCTIIIITEMVERILTNVTPKKVCTQQQHSYKWVS